jgi:hypothetical protein
MSNRIQVSRIPIKPLSALPPGAKAALIGAKNRLRDGLPMTEFGNEYGAYEGDGSPLPQLSAGCAYLEVQAGESRDPLPTRGKKRFVIEFHTSSRQIREIYYTEDHYLKFSFFRIVQR